MRESLQALIPHWHLAEPWTANECISRSKTLQPFPSTEHCSKFLPSTEMRSESRAGRGKETEKHQVAQLHPGGRSQTIPISKQKSELKLRLEAQALESREWGAISHHTQVSEGPKTQPHPKTQHWVCCVLLRALRPQTPTRQGSLPSSNPSSHQQTNSSGIPTANLG